MSDTWEQSQNDLKWGLFQPSRRAAYEKALAGGETASEYKTRTGVSKQKIKTWRESIAKQDK